MTVSTRCVTIGMCVSLARSRPIVGQIGAKWNKSGHFEDNVLKINFKGRRFVPFRANLTHLGRKSVRNDVSCSVTSLIQDTVE